MSETRIDQETWRQYMEREAREADRADREFAVRRMCGAAATRQSPGPLPSLSDEQAIAAALPLYRVLVDLLDAVENHNSGAYTARISRAWCRGRELVKRASETEVVHEPVE